MFQHVANVHTIRVLLYTGKHGSDGNTTWGTVATLVYRGHKSIYYDHPLAANHAFDEQDFDGHAQLTIKLRLNSEKGCHA